MDERSKNNKEDKNLKSKLKGLEDPDWERISKELKNKKFNKNAKQCRER